MIMSAQVKSTSVLATSNHILVIHDYQSFLLYNFLNGNTFTSLIIFVDILDEAAPQLKYWTGQATCDQASYHEDPSKKKTGPSRKLSRFQEFVLTMVRLRLSLLTFVLSDLFSISHSRVSQTFTTWINFMDCVFTPLLKWPSSARVRIHMPRSFRMSSKTTCIIDCTEFLIEKPKSPTAQSQTYSNYKHAKTYKKLLWALLRLGHSTLYPNYGEVAHSDQYITK